MLVYRYKNPSGYVAGWIMLTLMKYTLGNGKGFSHALNFFVIQRNSSGLISKELGGKDFSMEQLPINSFIILCKQKNSISIN